MADELKKGPVSADLIENINEDFDNFENWVMDNWRLIAAFCVGVVVLVAAVGIGMAVHKSMVRKTAQAFASAEGYEKLAEVLKAHPNAAAAPDARMKLAMLQAGKKDYAAALENFKLIGASKNASEALKYRAALNTGYVLELQGKNDDAIAAFSGVAQTALLPDEVRFEANYAAGRLLYAKGDFEKAKAALAKATSVRPRSMSEYFWSSQARSLLDRLQAGAPASTPAPAPKTKG